MHTWSICSCPSRIHRAAQPKAVQRSPHTLLLGFIESYLWLSWGVLLHWVFLLSTVQVILTALALHWVHQNNLVQVHSLGALRQVQIILKAGGGEGRAALTVFAWLAKMASDCIPAFKMLICQPIIDSTPAKRKLWGFPMLVSCWVWLQYM